MRKYTELQKLREQGLATRVGGTTWVHNLRVMGLKKKKKKKR